MVSTVTTLLLFVSAPLLMGIEVHGSILERAAVKHTNKYWPDGRVPYYIENTPAGLQNLRQTITNGMREWESKTCVRFQALQRKPADNQQRYLRISDDGPNNCESEIGNVAGASNMFLNSGCHRTLMPGITLHELGHVLGLYHEQRRDDRGQYVTVMWDNLDQRYNKSFARTPAFVTTYDLPYDYDSIMHYPPDSRTKNGKFTIVTKDPMKQFVIGQRDHLSFLDVKIVNLMYKCGANCPNAAMCQNGGYIIEQSGCNTCICPPEFQGSRCETPVPPRAAECGGEINLAMGETRDIDSYSKTVDYPNGRKCVWVINAPARRHVQITFTASGYFPPNGNPITCRPDFLEVRHEREDDGPRFCSRTVTGQKFVTTGSKLLLFQSLNYDINGRNRGFKAIVTSM